MTELSGAEKTARLASYKLEADGLTDHTAAIQTLLDNIETAGGGEVVLGAGTFTVSGLIRVGNNTTLRGHGYATLIKADGVTVFSGSWPAASGGDDIAAGIISVYKKVGVAICNLRIDGNSSTKNDAEAHGIHFMEATDFFVDKVWIQSIPSDGAGLASGGDGIMIQDADLTDNPCERGIIQNFHIENTLRQGIAVTYVKTLSISDGDIKSCGKEGIDIEPNATDEVDDVTISNVNINIANFGIAASGAGPIKNVTINGGVIKATVEGAIVVSPSSGGTKPDGVVINGTIADGCNTNNTAEASSEGDISIQANNVEVNGFISKNGGTCGARVWDSDNVSFNGGTLRGHRYSGIWVDAARGLANTSVKNLSIIGVKCLDNGKQGSGTHYGIKLEDASTKLIDDIVLDGNTCQDEQGTQTQTYGLGHVGTSSSQADWIIGENNLNNNLTGAINGAFDEFSWKSLTISGGAITSPRTRRNRPIKIQLVGEGATTDTLDTINGASEGDVIMLRNSQSSYTISCSNAVGNLRSGGATQSLDNERDIITYVYDTSSAEWLMQSFVSNA